MHRGHRFFSSLLLIAALALPVAMMATPDDDKDHDKNSKRYYDKSNKDYHTWDSNEDRSYKQYQTEHHQRRGFDQLNHTQQSNYWKWRHNNPDNK